MKAKYYEIIESKGKGIPVCAWKGLEGSSFAGIWHVKVVRSALHTGHLEVFLTLTFVRG